jgi:RNA polymerase sigma factor (sigma-70 family)
MSRITWNIVNKTGRKFRDVRGPVQRRLAKIEERLPVLPEKTAHLQVVIGYNSRKNFYSISLNLQVPRTILHADETYEDLEEAVGAAINDLVRQIDRWKSKLRREDRWKKRARRERLREMKSAFTEAPLLEGAGPQSLRDMVADVLQAEYDELLDFVRRQIREYVVVGTLPDAVIDPADIVNEVAEQTLREPTIAKPEPLSYRNWFFSLAFHETRKAVERFLEESHEAVPLDMNAWPSENSLSPAEEGLERPLPDIVERVIDPGSAVVPKPLRDPAMPPPDVQAEERETIEGIRKIIRKWPKMEREIFELHVFEGLSAEEIGAVFGSDVPLIERYIAQGRERLWFALGGIVGEEKGGHVSEGGVS